MNIKDTIIQRNEVCSSMLNKWALSSRDRNLERLINLVAQENKGCYIFPIFTFNLMNDKFVIEEARAQFNGIEDKNVPIYTMFAISDGNIGHHCAAVYDRGEVVLFDPMQTSNESLYIQHFKEIAIYVFMTHDIHVQTFNTDKNYTLQSTGGMHHISPSHVIEDESGAWYETNMLTGHQRKMTDEAQHALRFTSTETQNKWSYMWCLWYIHTHMTGLDLVQSVNNNLVGIDPLIVIKNYVWNIMTYSGFKKEMTNVAYFNDNFQYLLLYEPDAEGWWTTMPYKQHFSSKNALTHVNTCLEKSWDNNVSKI